uniref:Uncharacterized protein n=1 Tax=Panagrolaimus sp. ES5 TaxID=591445 RepID=A0AC34G4R5_9BILA
MSADSHTVFDGGDSVVSVFSMDRKAADKVKNSQQQQDAAARPLIDFEKEEFRERIAALEENLAARDLDLAKAHKLIKGLNKLIPKADENSTESPSFIDDRLTRERAKLLADLDRTLSISAIVTEEDSFQPQYIAHTTAAIDLVMNGTLAPQDLQTMKFEFIRFRDLCTKMFQQLQGTATFLERLIRHLESSDDAAAKQLLAKIKSIHLDLNTSMQDASVMIESAQPAKQLLAKIKSIHLDLNTSMQDASVMIESAQHAEMNLTTALEKSVRVSMAPNSEVIALTDKIIQAEKNYAELEKKYSEIFKDVKSLTTKNQNLEQKLHEATVKSENLETVITEKDRKLAHLMEEKRLKEEKAQNLVPEILQEMTNIKTTLENVSEASKHLAKE